MDDEVGVPNVLPNWLEFLANTRRTASDAFAQSGGRHPPMALVIPREKPSSSKKTVAIAYRPQPGWDIDAWLGQLREAAKYFDAQALLIIVESNVARFHNHVAARAAVDVMQNSHLTPQEQVEALQARRVLMLHAEDETHAETWLASVVQPTTTRGGIELVEQATLESWERWRSSLDEGNAYQTPFGRLIGGAP